MLDIVKNAKTAKVSLAIFMAAMLLFMPVAASAASSVQAPFTGTATINGVSQQISGVFNITSFAVKNGQLVATGTLNFLLNGVQQVIKTTAAVTAASGTCTILDLTIGAIHLDLLGLVIDTNTIHLQITAESGSGNLLGNLLCLVANLLNGGLGSVTGAALNQLASLLNQILAAL